MGDWKRFSGRKSDQRWNYQVGRKQKYILEITPFYGKKDVNYLSISFEETLLSDLSFV
jgi:hypothetical protein